MINNAWNAQAGTGATVQLPTGPVNVNSLGWPGHDFPPAYTQADAVAVWNSIMLSAPPINGGALILGGDGWWAWGAGRFCLFLYQPDNTPWRYILYDSVTGGVTFVIL